MFSSESHWPGPQAAPALGLASSQAKQALPVLPEESASVGRAKILGPSTPREGCLSRAVGTSFLQVST